MNTLLLFLATKGIIGPLDWRPITEFPINSPEYKNSLAVGVIKNAYQEICNGTHLGLGKVVTANHCCTANDVTFNYNNCSILSQVVERDICYLKCHLSENYPKVKTGSEITKDLHILHWQCLWTVDPYCKLEMMYSPGEMMGLNGSSIAHTCDTLNGSSGAGVYNDKSELIGIHSSFGTDRNWGNLIGGVE